MLQKTQKTNIGVIYLFIYLFIEFISFYQFFTGSGPKPMLVAGFRCNNEACKV